MLLSYLGGSLDIFQLTLYVAANDNCIESLFPQNDFALCHTKSQCTRVCSTPALFPGHVRGEKATWYQLLVHAHPFPGKPGNPCTFLNSCKTDMYMSDSLPFIKRQVRKHFLMHVGYLQTCEHCASLLVGSPFKPFQLAYTDTDVMCW